MAPVKGVARAASFTYLGDPDDANFAIRTHVRQRIGSSQRSGALGVHLAEATSAGGRHLAPQAKGVAGAAVLPRRPLPPITLEADMGEGVPEPRRAPAAPKDTPRDADRGVTASVEDLSATAGAGERAARHEMGATKGAVARAREDGWRRP